MYALAATKVVLAGSLNSGRELNSVSAIDTTPILHW